MAAFVQIVEYRTSRIDEVMAMGEEYAASSGDFARKVTVTEDRDHPGTFRTIAEFDSYDAAMKNSTRPETAAFAEQMMKLCDGPPTFYNLDVRQTFDIG